PADVETERRVTKMLKQLEEQAEPPVPVASEPLYVRDLSGKMRLNVNRTEQPTEPKPSAEELEKKAAEDKKAARITELKQARDAIYKNRTTPGFMQMAATNPAFTRDGNAGLREVTA